MQVRLEAEHRATAVAIGLGPEVELLPVPVHGQGERAARRFRADEVVQLVEPGDVGAVDGEDQVARVQHRGCRGAGAHVSDTDVDARRLVVQIEQRGRDGVLLRLRHLVGVLLRNRLARLPGRANGLLGLYGLVLVEPRPQRLLQRRVLVARPRDHPDGRQVEVTAVGVGLRTGDRDHRCRADVAERVRHRARYEDDVRNGQHGSKDSEYDDQGARGEQRDTAA